MLGQYLLTFREGLEAALIISIMLLYLDRTKNMRYAKYVWSGVGASVLSGVLVSIVVMAVYGELSSAGAKLFEGVASILAGIVLTTMIVWMAKKGRHMEKHIKQKIQKHIDAGTAWGIAGFSFVVVFREVVELILFMIPFATSAPMSTLFGVILGLIFAGGIAIGLYYAGEMISLRKVFYYTSLLLIFLAAGLFGYGVHELLSYGELKGVEFGWIGENAYSIGLEKGTLFHHKGAIGSIFGVMFGYSTSMEWGRVLIHAGYLLIFLPIVMGIYKESRKIKA